MEMNMSIAEFTLHYTFTLVFNHTFPIGLFQNKKNHIYQVLGNTDPKNCMIGSRRYKEALCTLTKPESQKSIS